MGYRAQPPGRGEGNENLDFCLLPLTHLGPPRPSPAGGQETPGSVHESAFSMLGKAEEVTERSVGTEAVGPGPVVSRGGPVLGCLQSRGSLRRQKSIDPVLVHGVLGQQQDRCHTALQNIPQGEDPRRTSLSLGQGRVPW